MDDLLFSSKIRTTAKQAGVELAFARTPADILSQARALKPTLIIFDLNSPKIDPINTVTALRQDPELAAREAGVDEVMARSAFAANLDKILLEGR